MPDTPMTVREWLADEERKAIEGAGGPCVWETKSQYGDAWAQMLDWLESFGILDALIGAQGRVVYTAKDVAAAAKVVCRECPMRDRDCVFLNEGEESKCGYSPDIARAVITAAGGVVADKVVEVDGVSEARVGVRNAKGWSVEKFSDGDKLYVVRPKKE